MKTLSEHNIDRRKEYYKDTAGVLCDNCGKEMYWCFPDIQMDEFGPVICTNCGLKSEKL